VVRISILTLLFALGLSCAIADDTSLSDNSTFAVVNGESISAERYLIELSRGMRQRFYHGNIPAEQLAQFRQEIADRLIDETLLLQEAGRRGVEADHKEVEQQLEQYEKRYAGSEQWQSRRGTLMPQLREELEGKSRLSRIREHLKETGPISRKAAMQYYRANPDKFTSPERRKISLILLKVDPSSPASSWDNARSEGAALVARIKGGESFAELAKLHSADGASASKGGDMGFLHKGMLAESVESAIEQLKEGETSAPITTLQGIVVVRLEKRLGAQLNSFDTVEERAVALVKRERAEQQYLMAMGELRKGASLKVNNGLIEQRQP